MSPPKVSACLAASRAIVETLVWVVVETPLTVLPRSLHYRRMWPTGERPLSPAVRPGQPPCRQARRKRI